MLSSLEVGASQVRFHNKQHVIESAHHFNWYTIPILIRIKLLNQDLQTAQMTSTIDAKIFTNNINVQTLKSNLSFGYYDINKPKHTSNLIPRFMDRNQHKNNTTQILFSGNTKIKICSSTEFHQSSSWSTNFIFIYQSFSILY
ncbi:unnamed protein product [Ambrosiozyma monospora]|uniref:Unnamed protein product n=1 Tax=Ambrosiozyma monospora TaxID=43982 RepID=A0ACB5T7D1_AMBMO|nr:unnamed protein product [Ambrosiozyma monospora]